MSTYHFYTPYSLLGVAFSDKLEITQAISNKASQSQSFPLCGHKSLQQCLLQRHKS